MRHESTQYTGVPMTLLVFDMDGTLLDAQSRVSPYTGDTLKLLEQAGIAYTVATGRTLQAARGPITGHRFALPHIVKNGAGIWCPEKDDYLHTHLLTQAELWHVLAAFTLQDITPFVFTLEDNGRHAVYHGPLRTSSEKKLAELFEDERTLPLEPLSAMPPNAQVINVSAMGPETAIDHIIENVRDEPSLVTYTGTAIEAKNLRWLDIHHHQGSKGNAITTLREELAFEHIIVFGDGENDTSMFAVADEAYAPSNADHDVKAMATAVIGHHNEDGVARFLRERFKLAG